jgi:NADH-quinone oxidoreductase chain G
MILIEINETPFLIKKDISILEAIKLSGIVVPKFCYHELLSVAGNCRMCLVEVFNNRLPVASCSILVTANIKVYTDTPTIKKARENIMEILLLNHPMDCPVCDQGGECDLQDQSKTYGSDTSRSLKFKTSNENKEFGSFIKTVMTRCIQCTRCVRYNNEIIGSEVFGILNRGSNTEIGNYIPKILESELSGNIIDVCPVGALTSKPYPFKIRPWEGKTIETVDANDSLGDNIVLTIKGCSIEKVTPKYVDNYIISDRSRFSHDFLNNKRLTKLLRKKLESFNFECISWTTFINTISKLLYNKTKNLFIINEELEINSLLLIKFLVNKYRKIFEIKSVCTSKASNSLNFYNSWYQNYDSNYLKVSKLCIIFSSNLKIENTILNSKLRLKFFNENFKVVGISGFYNSKGFIEFINFKLQNALKLIETKVKKLSKLLIQYKNPFICIGESNQCRNLSLEIFYCLKLLIPTTTFLSIRHSSNSEGCSFLNILPLTKKNLIHVQRVLIINLDDSIRLYKLLKGFTLNKEIIWFVTHSSNLCFKTADIIVPIITYLEESQIFVNSEQKAQKTVKALSIINTSKSLNSLISLIANLKITKLKKAFFDFNFEIISNSKLFNSIVYNSYFSKKLIIISNLNKIKVYPIKLEKEDFYQYNKYTKNSLVLTKHSLELRKVTTNFSKSFSF